MFNWFYNDNQLPAAPGNLIQGLFSVLQDTLAPGTLDQGFKTDIAENNSGYVITAELPGFSKDDININLDKNHLTITVFKREETVLQNNYFSGRSIKTQVLSHTFYMQNIPSNNIKGKFEDGILKLWLPKLAHSQSKVYLLK